MKYKLLVVATIVLTTTQLTAQHKTPATKSNSSQWTAAQRSYQQARKVLDDGIAAMGGVEALRGIKDFTLKEKGKVHALFQSEKPEAPFSVGNSEETLIVDLNRGYVFDELKTANGGFNTWVTTVIKGTEGQTFDMWSRTTTPIANPSVNNFRGQMRRLPPFVLLEALDRAATLRYLGEDEIGGKRQKVISVLRPDNQQLSLSFDAETSLLTKYGYLYGDPMVGDSEIAQTYAGYRSVGNIKLPSSRVLYNSGLPTQEVEYTELAINTKPAETVFAGPTGFEKLAAPPANPQALAVNKIATDVYLLQGLCGGTHNTLFVAFDDHILVFEAPEQIIYGNNSNQAIAKIKETVPGKPIKYLVLSHHHSDHMGGFREYVAEGTTVITTAGNKNFIERTSAVDSSLLPKLAKRSPVIELVDKKRVFQDSNHVVELYDIGPNPHANEILVAYLPKEKILFQADLLNPAANGTIPIAQDTTLSFSERLEQLGLSVEKIYGVHGRPATPEELRTSVAKRRASELKIQSGQ